MILASIKGLGAEENTNNAHVQENFFVTEQIISPFNFKDYHNYVTKLNIAPKLPQAPNSG